LNDEDSTDSFHVEFTHTTLKIDRNFQISRRFRKNDWYHQVKEGEDDADAATDFSIPSAMSNLLLGSGGNDAVIVPSSIFCKWSIKI